jgi:ApbE superfamily uncharacterized protein (UPF0280 family)
MSAQVQVLADGRLHLNHGPIDLICQAWGPPDALRAGYARAIRRFEVILPELVAELTALRAENQVLTGALARKMAAAVAPYRPRFITPMAAVAGAVADEVLAHLTGPGITRAYVNNGGDIALHLAAGESLTCALAQGGQVVIKAHQPVRGIATSGWRGRSWSLGIADAVTVLARNAAMADAAATMIANAVDLPGHPAIERRPARDLQADSDLGMRLVTVGVGPLAQAEIARALDAGLRAARDFSARGLIEGAALFLQGEVRTFGQFTLPQETAVA